MTVDAERPVPKLPALSARTVLPLARALAAGLLLLAAGCSVDSHSTSLGIGPAGTVASSYTIGGAITGVSGSGLVLVNGSTTVSVVSGASSFVFPMAVASGTAYAVTVQASPSGLLCSVAGGAGTVQTANVNSIVVTCATNAYTLGGAVSGLTASGLVLKNGSDTVSVPSGASSYTLPTPVASGSGYNVAVQAEPASGVYCSVANGSGAIRGQNVTNVNVSCSSQPFTVGGPITGLTTAGLVLANTSGTTVTVPANATSFAIPVAFGSTYTISVQTPPTGLTCALTNPTGAMPASNVTNVQVACADQSYHLTGTITGLTASGLVIAAGSITQSVPSGASSYSLSIPFGTHYTVTAMTQPAGLTCSVSSTGATGTMPAQDQTGPSVVCAPTTYTVGGSISGLVSSGLVLRLNNGSLQAEQPNAQPHPYTLPDGITAGTPYTVNVVSQPPYYQCVVNPASGTMAAQDVTDANVTCTPNPEYVYSQDYGTDDVLIYSVDPSTHQLSAPATFPVGSGSGPGDVVVNASGTMLYSVNGGYNNVSWYLIDPSSGALTAPSANSVASGGGYPTQLVLNAAGTLAWVVNQNGSSIQAYIVNGDGSLNPQGSAVATPLTSPRSLTLHPSLPLMYVPATGGVMTFSFDPGTGIVTWQTTATADLNPWQLAINAQGTYAYVAARDASLVDQYSVTTGALSPNPLSTEATGSDPQSLTLDASGDYLYTANNSSGNVSEFSVGAAGVLTANGTAASAAAPATVTVDPISGYLFVVSGGGDYAHSIQWFSISTASGTAGQLIAAGTAASPSGTYPSAVAFAAPTPP